MNQEEKITLSIDIGRGDELTGFCVKKGDTILYLGTNPINIRQYKFTEVIVSEYITYDQLKELLK